MATEKEIAAHIQNDCNESAVNGSKTCSKATKMAVHYSLGEKYMLPKEEC